MKKFLITLSLLLPFGAFAHAVPTSYTPAHGALIPVSPVSVSVSFTDRVDPDTAALILHRATGTPLQLTAYLDQHDPRTLHATLPELRGGATIMWGVTSLDDGHYTRGAYNFSVVSEGDVHVAATKKPIDEVSLTYALFAASGMLIVLCALRLICPAKILRCRTCVYSFVLLTVLIGAQVLLVSLLLLFTPLLPGWKNETKDDGITITLHTGADSPLMHLTVQSREALPAPLFEVSNRAASIDPMPVALTALSKNGKETTYSFPASVFVPHGDWHVSTTFVRGDQYDAHGAITFAYPDDILSAIHMSPIHAREAWVALALSFFALLFAAWTVFGPVAEKSGDRIPIG